MNCYKYLYLNDNREWKMNRCDMNFRIDSYNEESKDNKNVKKIVCLDRG